MEKSNDGPWREYLLKACQENRPWDQLFREMLLIALMYLMPGGVMHMVKRLWARWRARAAGSPGQLSAAHAVAVPSVNKEA